MDNQLITEIIYGDSTFYSINKSNLNKNNIIKNIKNKSLFLRINP